MGLTQSADIRQDPAHLETATPTTCIAIGRSTPPAQRHGYFFGTSTSRHLNTAIAPHSALHTTSRTKAGCRRRMP